MPNKVLWICGKMTGNEFYWEFQGVFDSQEDAVTACLTNQYFIGPVDLNTIYPDECVEWPGCYYPEEGDNNYANN